MHKCFRLLLCLIALQTVVYAEGEWTFNSQWLFLAPSFDDTVYVTQGVPGRTGRNNDYGFRPASRVKVGFSDPCNDCNFAVFYTYLYARKNQTIDGSQLNQVDLLTSSAINYTGTATTQNQLIYQGVDALMWKTLWNPTSFQLNVVFGAEYAYARLFALSQYTTVQNLGVNFSRRTRFWGVGPEMGLDLEYKLASVGGMCPGQINLNVLCTGSLLVSRSTARMATRVPASAATPSYRSEDSWRIIPALHARCGLSYDLTVLCLKASLEVGYEVNTYIRAFEKPILTGNQLVVLYNNFNTQGPFAGLNLIF